ncbi:helix-turn-helix domain-containing protein [Streptomyces sp. NPDC046862]|uniref:TetR/AcrR family transcriptional regulator n=1 Tax=Streptomyces sp. NPDC046862 TaxID=3154603 RepID=UPI003453E725
MSPRNASVNEELRRRSRERLLRAAVELVSERGYEETTLGDIADRAGAARGLVPYYFPGKRQLVRSAVHRLMHRTLEEALEREPRTEDGPERMARAIDAVLELAREQPVLMRRHMAGLLRAGERARCAEQQRLAELLRDTVARHGSTGAALAAGDYALLGPLLMVPKAPAGRVPAICHGSSRRPSAPWAERTAGVRTRTKRISRSSPAASAR